MNIFEIFCDGKGRINETNMTSVLSYLLNPVNSHGYGLDSLAFFLEPIEKKLPEEAKNGQDKRKTIKAWLKKYRIDFELEYPCTKPDGYNNDQNQAKNLRRIDIVIKFFSKEKEDLEYIIAIENKIDRKSISKNQIQEEYDFLRAEIDKKIKIFFIFLTPLKEE